MNRKFRGNQYVSMFFANLWTKYVVNPFWYTVDLVWRATKVTVFMASAIVIFSLVVIVILSIRAEKNADASEAPIVNLTATSTTATSTPTFTKESFAKVYKNYPFPPFLQRICRAESSGTHYRYGQVIINHTQDMGSVRSTCRSGDKLHTTWNTIFQNSKTINSSRCTCSWAMELNSGISANAQRTAGNQVRVQQITWTSSNIGSPNSSKALLQWM